MNLVGLRAIPLGPKRRSVVSLWHKSGNTIYDWEERFELETNKCFS